MAAQSRIGLLSLFFSEKDRWEVGIANVTGEVQQQVFTIIQRARKNYTSIYDNVRDPITGRKKLFFPLTETMVEGVMKNTDLDTKDMQVRGSNPAGIGPAIILRHKIRNWMNTMNFSDTLNTMIRFGAIDGTVVAKVVRVPVDGVMTPKVIIPDLLNILFDPTDDRLENGVIERFILPIDEFRRIAKDKGWKNIEAIKGIDRPFRTNEDITTLNQVESEVPFVTVWERWGKVSSAHIKRFQGVKVEEGDDNDWHDGHSVFHIDRNADGAQIGNILFVEEVDIMPYKIWRYRKVHGRAHGKGVAEILFDMQVYMNELINIRANTNRLKHTGLFKARKGQGITNETIAALVSGGVIPVNRQDDFVELRQSDQLQSSYADESNIFLWAQRVTGNFPIVTGESLPASQPATSAVISQQGATSGFDLIKENFGIFLKELFEDLIIPALVDSFQEGEEVRITGDQEDLRAIDNAVKNWIMQDETKKFFKANGRYPRNEVLQELEAKVEQQFEKLGGERYIKIAKKSFNTKFNVEFFVTNESFDKAVEVRNLIDLLGLLSQTEPGANIQSLGREIIDLMGRDGARILRERPLPAPRNQLTQPRAQVESAQEQITGARTLERLGSTPAG